PRCHPTCGNRSSFDPYFVTHRDFPFLDHEAEKPAAPVRLERRLQAGMDLVHPAAGIAFLSYFDNQPLPDANASARHARQTNAFRAEIGPALPPVEIGPQIAERGGPAFRLDQRDLPFGRSPRPDRPAKIARHARLA